MAIKANLPDNTLTKREQIAAMALQGLLSFYKLNSPEDPEIIAKVSVRLADCLLSELQNQ